MQRYFVRKISYTAMLTALTCVATMVIRVPTPTGGYVNLGDVLVVISGVLLGPGWAMIAAGVGSAMSDFLAGYMLWVPATLIIKGIMALSVGWIYRRIGRILPAAIFAEFIMVLGYFAFEALLMGQGLGAAAGIPGNAVQGAFGCVVSIILLRLFRKNETMRQLFPELKS